MSLPVILQNLRLPVIGAPLFIISNPDLVIAQCCSGVVGSFPTLNARPAEELEKWLIKIKEGLDDYSQKNPDTPAAPYAVNQIVHKSNDRLEHDIEMCVKHEVPITITSLGARKEVNDASHSYGGIVLHDIINNRFAKKAIEKGADGLIAVAAGAGGHAGTLSPMALIQEIREWFDGTLALSGCIAHGRSILASLAMGADLAYIGSAFIATNEANADMRYKEMIVEYSADDIVYSNLFSGVLGNYLKPSIIKAGLDPDNLPESQTVMNFGSQGGLGDEKRNVKAWKDIWGSGQGIGAVKAVLPVADMVSQLRTQYEEARTNLKL